MRPKLKVRIPLGESGEGQITSADKAKGGTVGDELERRNAAPREFGPMSAGPLTGTNGSTWGNLLLPPPSPSSYLTSSVGGGPGNPFSRPPLISNGNGEQTPLSAAVPSRYINDLLPSPSNFYGGDWALFGGSGPTSANTGNTTTAGPSSSVNTTSGGSNAVGSYLSQRNTHLGLADMLPSPLHFNTPIVTSSSQSLSDLSAHIMARSPTTAVAGPSRLGGTVPAPPTGNPAASGSNASAQKREGDSKNGPSAKRPKTDQPGPSGPS